MVEAVLSTPATTTTTIPQHWLLVRCSRTVPYSKSDPSGDPPRDHYSPPQLALRLDTTFAVAPRTAAAASPSSSSSSPSYLSVSKLLIVTCNPLFRASAAGTRRPQAVELDSLDLTSFSGPAVRAATPPDQLSFETVYRDAVFGLRYLSLATTAAGGPPRLAGFRRIQAKCTSTAERHRCVQAIQALVPTKPATTVEFGPANKKPKKSTTRPRPRSATAALCSGGGGRPAESARAALAWRSEVSPKTLEQPARSLPLLPPQEQQETKCFRRAPIGMGKGTGSGTRTDDDPGGSRLRTDPPAAPLSALLPRLSTAAAALIPQTATTTASATASRLLAALPANELESNLREALHEERFDALVHRVQDALMGQSFGNLPET